jgi:glycerol-3-phosphate acyltransferase PlsX
MIRIAVDAMGGDHAPSAIVDGAVAAAAGHSDIQISLVGATTSIEAELCRHPNWRELPIDVIAAPDVVPMAARPADLRRKPGASIRVASNLVARRDAAALFSAGHTGATVVAAHTALGMIPGVERPAVAATIPTRSHPAVLLDAGANIECRPHHLLQFAVMGSAYARLALGLEHPRVGLLSVGEEETKGNELTREAHRLLKAAAINFVGNVDGREIYSGAADVIVCDGFTGNVVLKSGEGLVEALQQRFGERLSRVFDYSEYGGAPLLGIAGLAVIGHGRSSAKAVTSAIAMAHRFAAADFVERLRKEIAASAATQQ